MSRKNNIKWRDSDNKELRRVVRNFNTKIDRTIKKHPELAKAQPVKISVKDLKSKITTRNDLKREIKSLSRYMKKGAEKPVVSKTGNVVTKWERKEIGIKVGIINRKRAIERKKAEYMDTTSQGIPTGFKRGEMGSVRMKSLEPKKYDFDKIKGGKEWDKFVESVEKQIVDSYDDERMERYKTNYIKGLENALGGYADDIIEIIKGLPAESVVNTFYSEQEATIDFHYDPIQNDLKVEILKDIWTNVANSRL